MHVSIHIKYEINLNLIEQLIYKTKTIIMKTCTYKCLPDNNLRSVSRGRSHGDKLCYLKV